MVTNELLQPNDIAKITAPIGLVILDGFGYSYDQQHNAITKETAPYFFSLLEKYPYALLHASGKYVGLPNGMIGNSEVGHLTIGAGRVIEQPAQGITRMIDSGKIFSNKTLSKHFNNLKKTGGRLHILGLLSDAGSHALENHLIAIFECAVRHDVQEILIHPILDGRDTLPKSATQYLTRLEGIIKKFKRGTIASLHGRFYAMDRDQEWERTEKSYHTLTMPQTTTSSTWQEALEKSYVAGITDEFFIPVQLHERSAIEQSDGIIFCNFREDRARQLTLALIKPQLTPLSIIKKTGAWMITAIEYMPNLGTSILYKTKVIKNTLFDILEQHQKKLFSIAETEKYAHITYFFNGGKETIRKNETRILIPSVRHQTTYADTPEMSAPAITRSVIDSLEHSDTDFYLINYANPDMVGHSGDFKATREAIKCIDTQIKILIDYFINRHNGTLFITADHGKAECMWDAETQQIKTAHTTKPVYFLLINEQNAFKNKTIAISELSHIAPLILTAMSIKKPQEMNHIITTKKEFYEK